jgi:aspartyl/asparaginyl beta-hydroxylase (cupin superfamily)
MFFKANDFPFTHSLTENWEAVLGEVGTLQPREFLDWPERTLYENRWEVYGLYAFGRKIERNCELCPTTTQLVEAIPGLTTAGFSRLRAHSRILPHIGYSHAVLRCHLGLIVPGGCGLRVGAEVRAWIPGQCLVFDDTLEHEAWNDSDDDRTVLLIDFLKTNNPS